MRFALFLILAIMVCLCGVANGADVDQVATAATSAVIAPDVDRIALWWGIAAGCATFLGIILSAVAGIVRLFKPQAAWLVWFDTVAGWCSAIGTKNPLNRPKA